MTGMKLCRCCHVDKDIWNLRLEKEEDVPEIAEQLIVMKWGIAV